MRHRHAFRKLGRTSAHRRAMLRNIVTSLFEHEQIKTTDAKAKELRAEAERMISLAKEGSLHARRQALAYIQSKEVVHKLFTEIGPRYAGRPGGCVQVLKTGFRAGDAAPMSVVTLITDEAKKPSRRQRRRAKASAQAPQPPAKPEAKPEPAKES